MPYAETERTIGQTRIHLFPARLSPSSKSFHRIPIEYIYDRYGELRDIKQTRYITGIPRYYLNYVMINDPTRKR